MVTLMIIVVVVPMETEEMRRGGECDCSSCKRDRKRECSECKLSSQDAVEVLNNLSYILDCSS